MDQLSGIKTFIAVVECGSFTAASERLGISKKLASKYIQELEKRLGVRLINRTTRSLSTTEAGQHYYEESGEILVKLSTLEADLSVGQKRLNGKLRIAVPFDFGRSYLAPMIGTFSRENPLIEIDLHMSDRYVDIVTEGFDLAIRVGEHEDSTLVSRLVATTDIWIVAAPSLFSGSKLPMHPEDLAGFPVLQDTNYRVGDLWQFRLGGKVTKLYPRSSLRVNSAETVKDLAILGHGIARCPAILASKDVTDGKLIRLLPDYSVQKSEIRVILPSSRYMPEKVRRFVDFVVAEDFKDQFRNA